MDNLNNEGNVLLLLAAITQHQQMSLLETLFSINQDPSNDALELIAQRINSSTSVVANWFQARREQQRAQQVAAAAVAASSVSNAAAAAGGVGPTSQQALQSLVLNNLVHLEHQQQLHNLPQHQLLQQLQAAGACQQLLNSTNSSNNSSTPNNFYYDYPLSNASSSPPTSLTINQNNHGIQSAINLQHGNSLGANNNNSNSSNMNGLDMSPSPPLHHQQSHHHQQSANGGPAATSNILAKLTAVTSNLTIPLAGNGQQQQTPLYVNKLDSRMIDLLEALYAINDNPEMGAIEMISKRIGAPCHLITEWFDKKRLKLNPFAGPRSPPVNKKREGGRVVTFSEYQRSLLEAIFNENNYLHPQEYEELSKLIQVPSRNIKIWFKNRRSKQRLSSSTAH